MLRLACTLVCASLLLVLLPAGASADDFIGNEFRITHHGTDGDVATVVASPEIAYNPKLNQFLVVFVGDDPAGDEIYGQLFDATGAPIGGEFVVSGPSFVEDTGSNNPPSVAFNTATNEYLVAWTPDSDDRVVIQRVGAAGNPVGTDDGVISNHAFNDIETNPVVYNPVTNEWLVVWKGTTAAEGQEVWAQRIGADGLEVGPDDIQVTDVNGAGADADDAPGVAVNTMDNRYLVVWHATDPEQYGVAGEYEIYGQLLAGDGSPVGADDFRISQVGTDNSTTFYPQPPSAVWDSVDNQWLVAFASDDNAGTQIQNELEVLGQRLDANGAEIGADDFRISTMGPDGNTGFGARRPRMAYSPVDNQYILVWHGVDALAGWFQIYGQRLNGADGSETGTDDFKISQTLPDLDAGADATRPDVLYNPASCDYLAVWQTGTQGGGNTSNNERDVYGRRIDASDCPPPPPPPPPPVAPPPPPPPPGLKPGACTNVKTGTAVGEILTGTTAGDLLRGLGGNDTLAGLSGDDCLFGGLGNDKLSGGAGNDKLAGEAGNDSLSGGAGKDKLSGGAGNDKLSGGAANDSLSGGAGNDKLSGGSGKNTYSGGAGNDNINSKNRKKESVSCGKGRDKVKADEVDKLKGCEVVRRS